MHRRGLVAALLLLLFGAGPGLGQSPAPAGGPADAALDNLGWLYGDLGAPVAAGNPEVNPDLWQQTWGNAGIDLFPIGQKMAPNGVPYDPLFALDLLLNIALTRDREVYIFAKSRFWAQKPDNGITNDSQGAFDFSKRQFDLDVGLAWNFYGRLEARAYLFSDNNINRGQSPERPAGYNDGFGIECRCYLASTDFDRGLYRFAGVGYMPTKDLVGADGELFKPGFYATANLAYDFMPQRFYAYLNADWISERYVKPKLLIADPGVALRPFAHCPNLEFRIGVESTIDLELAFTRSLLYGNVRIIW